MSLLDDITGFAGASLGEIGSHPLQAAGAAFGVPGYDPAIGGLFNNRPGGALLSPTGNFTSSTWQDMYNNNPGRTGALNMFSGLNSIADKIAPAIAGGYAAGALGAGGSGVAGGGSGINPSLAMQGLGMMQSGMNAMQPGQQQPPIAPMAYGGNSPARPPMGQPFGLSPYPYYYV